MPIIIGFFNPKGGCGKSSTLINLAGGLTKAGYNVGSVDADPQKTLVSNDSQSPRGIGFEVLPARPLRNPLAMLKLPYDIVLEDTPSGVLERTDEVSLFALRSMPMCDAIIIPLQPAPADFRACIPLVQYLMQRKPASQKVGVLINGRKHNKMGNSARDRALEMFQDVSNATVFQTTIGDRTAITEVLGSGQTIFDYVPASHPAAQEYFSLTKEVAQWLSKP